MSEGTPVKGSAMGFGIFVITVGILAGGFGLGDTYLKQREKLQNQKVQTFNNCIDGYNKEDNKDAYKEIVTVCSQTAKSLTE